MRTNRGGNKKEGNRHDDRKDRSTKKDKERGRAGDEEEQTKNRIDAERKNSLSGCAKNRF